MFAFASEALHAKCPRCRKYLGFNREFRDNPDGPSGVAHRRGEHERNE